MQTKGSLPVEPVHRAEYSAAIDAGRNRSLRVCHVHLSAWGDENFAGVRANGDLRPEHARSWGRWKSEPLRDLRNIYGHDVVAVIGKSRGESSDDLLSAGIPYIRADFTVRSMASIIKSPFKIIRLALLFRWERFDVVQSSIFPTTILCRIAAWLADVPVRLTMPASPIHLEAPASRWIDKVTCWMDTVLVSSCELTRSIYRAMGVSEDRLELIYYGPDASRFDPEKVAPVDLRLEYGWGKETRLIGNVAFFNPRGRASRWIPPEMHGQGKKGQEDIIRAAPRVLAEFPEARFLLIGSGSCRRGESYLNEMQDLVKELGLKGRVVFPGYRPDAPGIIRTLDVSIQAALVENLGGCVESLLLERPMVATNVGGMVDTVRDGETGVLVEAGNPASLAAGILRLLRDPEQARELGKAGRRLMLERFTLSSAVDSLHHLYLRQLWHNSKKKPCYRLHISLGRCLLLIPIALYLILRLTLADLFVLPLLDRWLPAPDKRSPHDHHSSTRPDQAELEVSSAGD